jgi:hypothetical protein
MNNQSQKLIMLKLTKLKELREQNLLSPHVQYTLERMYVEEYLRHLELETVGRGNSILEKSGELDEFSDHLLAWGKRLAKVFLAELFK